MTLATDIAWALPLLRTEAEGRMVDTCTIVRPGGAPTFDPNTGEYTTPTPTSVYSGKCEVQVADGLNAREAAAGATEVTINRLTLKIPISVTGVQEDDLVTIDSSRYDPELVGQTYTVTAGFAKSHATARRLQVERITT